MILKVERVSEIIKEQLKGKFVRRRRWFSFYPVYPPFLPDAEYWAAPKFIYEEIIQTSIIDQRKYVSERGDCDDFALLLKADFVRASWKSGERRRPYCFGEVWGKLPGPHAINWFIDDTETLYFVEPQDDKVFLPRETDKDIFLIKG